jgi:TolA-binding protein
MTTREHERLHARQTRTPHLAGLRARLAALSLGALFAAGAGVALGCGWNFENSVRFNLWASERERQRLPPLPYRLSAKDAPPEFVEYEVAERDRAAADALWTRIAAAADGGDLRDTAAALRQFVGYSHVADRERLNSAADQLDALKALDDGSAPETVRAYLSARRVHDERRAPVNRAAEGVPKDRNLDDNVAYLQAAGLYRDAQERVPAGDHGPSFAEAAAAFRRVVARYPRSEKREAALYMSARAAMGGSRAYVEGTATSSDACPDCRDDAWREARRGFTRLLAEHPRGRLAGEARGWLAYLAWRVGDRGGALAEYYRMLADESDAGASYEALMSLRLTRGRADEADMERVERELEDEPRAALAYAYHDIYNYTRSYYFSVPGPDADASSAHCSDFDDWCRDRERRRGETASLRAERVGLARVARFAARMVERHGGGLAGGAFVVRVAQANLEMGEFDAAHALARRALASGVAGAERAGALWVKALAEYRRRELDAARRTLAQVASEFRGGDVETRARRLLAVASEEAGDLEAALAEYLALGYETDAAYFVDVLMTPAQLASFVAQRPHHPRTNELLYALGVRYLRAGRYREARETLMRVRTTTADAADLYGRYHEYDPERESPKETGFADFFGPDYEELVAVGDADDPRRASFVAAPWVLRDLQTVADLERLSAAAERAAGREAKAEALYQLASYLYEGSNLKFYNPAAWRGWRAELLNSLDESRYRAPGEAETIWRHAREHESLARALDIYLEIVRQYPGTASAPDALYTAVLCHQRLSNFNGYWRRAYDEHGLHAGERVVTLADLRREYPRYRLPADGRWEPSTRTVGGLPAWPAPPAPKKLTGTERARRKLRRAEALVANGWALAGEVAGGRARRWSLVLLCALAAAAAWRLTRRSRAALRELLRRASERRAPRPAVMPRPTSSFAAHEPYTASARVRAAAARLGDALGEILLDARGRSALALNLLTHGLLTALLWALAWALRA